MDYAHLHLMINHIPVIGLGFAAALLIYAMAKKNEELKKASLWAFLIIALAAIPVNITGEMSEDAVEKLPGVSEAIIEKHDHMAFLALIGMEILGVIAAAGLLISRRGGIINRSVMVALLVVSIAAAGLVGNTAYLGGQIRHTEIRGGQPLSDGYDAGSENQQRGREKNDND